jgi:multisubunit Na+/H+ antiporter MnhF subunit
VHDLVFYVAVAWVAALIGVCVVAVVHLQRTSARILALDTLALNMVAFLVLFSGLQGSSYYLDAALILALLSFVGTIAAARYYGERRLF